MELNGPFLVIQIPAHTATPLPSVRPGLYLWAEGRQPQEKIQKAENERWGVLPRGRKKMPNCNLCMKELDKREYVNQWHSLLRH